MTYDFFSYDTVVNPYPVFDRLRETDPVFETNFGYWYVSRYDDANRLLRDGSLGAGRGVPDSMGITSGPLYDLMTTWMMAIDGPEHTHACAGWCRARSRHGRSRRCARRSRRWPTACATTWRRAAAATSSPTTRSRCPWKSCACCSRSTPTSGRRTSPRCSIPRPRRPTPDRSGRWARSPSGSSAWWRRAAATLGDDMFSAMLAPDEHGDALSTAEAVANAVLLVTAGFETTMSLITLAVWSLLTHPDQLGALRADPSLAAGAVEETLRYRTRRAVDDPVDAARPRGRGHDDPGGVEHPVLGGRGEPRPASLRRTPNASTSRAPTCDRSRSARARTCASAPRWRGSKARSRSARSCAGSPTCASPVTTLVWQTQNPTVRRPVALPVLV